MTQNQAAKCCDEINALDSVYVADVTQAGRGGSVGVVIRHSPSGNEIAFAGTVEEFRYVFDGIKRRLQPT